MSYEAIKTGRNSVVMISRQHRPAKHLRLRRSGAFGVYRHRRVIRRARPCGTRHCGSRPGSPGLVERWRIAMGIGIWEMHFKGMMAFHLPVPIEFHWPTVLVSLLLAIMASAVALYVASRQRLGFVEALTGSLFMGAGIVGLHYLCMAAMRLPAITRYSPLLITCSILAGGLLFSNRAAAGIRATGGGPVYSSAESWQRHRDGGCCFRNALHRNGCRKFHPCFSPGSFLCR